jgi:membrane-bound lytic murein transglycosylase D
MNREEKALFDLFQDIDEPNKFLNAAHRKRLRFQLGQKENFLGGLLQSGRYISGMEAVFKKEGMPVELTRLPFVESSFNIQARSKVGASGIWQFMRSTAQLFIQVNDAIDERNDPVKATEAAARLLKGNFDSLKSWPLAVTAYNHGRKGIMRAVRRVEREELNELFASYRSRSFGFASSNFFPELLAAIEVEKNATHYFGDLQRLKPVPYVEVKLPNFVQLSTLVKQFHWNKKEIVALNPALTDAVAQGKLWIPSGYDFRIPYPSEEINRTSLVQDFWEKYNQIPRSEKQQGQPLAKYGTSERLVKHHKKNRSS